MEQELTPYFGSTVSTQDFKIISSDVGFLCTEDPVGFFNLIVAANNHNLLWIGFSHDKTIKAVTCDTIIWPSGLIKLSGYYQFVYNLSFTPTILSIPQNGFSSILLVIGTSNDNHSVLEFFNIDTKTSISKLQLTDVEIIDHAWHPIYQNSIVALVTKSGTLLVVGLHVKDRNANVVYREQKFGATTCCWSPKGKNLAIGTPQGNIMRLELVLDSTNKSLTFKELEDEVIKVQRGLITSDHLIVKIHWMNYKYIVCLCAKLKNNQSDSIYSLVPIKSNEPIQCWPGPYNEQCGPNYYGQILSLTNIVIGWSSYSPQPVILGSVGGAEATESNNWKRIVADSDAQLDLSQDCDSTEIIYSRGATIVREKNDELTLIVYTSNGRLCPYSLFSTSPAIQLMKPQESQDCPIQIPRQLLPTPEENEDPLDLSPDTPPRKYAQRESIAQWSVDRKRRGMDVKKVASFWER